MGREQIDFRLKIKVNNSTDFIYKAWAFNRKTDEFEEVVTKII
jgi:hypothetical protein